MSARYEVSVGNVGIVYSGTNKRDAITEYYAYVSQSARRYGRASGEPVVFLTDGEIEAEYQGAIDNDELEKET